MIDFTVNIACDQKTTETNQLFFIINQVKSANFEVNRHTMSVDPQLPEHMELTSTFKDVRRVSNGEEKKKSPSLAAHAKRRSPFASKRITHERIHSNERPFQCPVCPQAFTQVGNLTVHLRTHTGMMPYRCSVCSRAFSDKSNLRRHEHSHTHQRRYRCSKCSRLFKDRSNLKVHMRSHTGERPYRCSVCLRNFSQKSHLTVHVRIHTGMMPYRCAECSRAFSDKSSLTETRTIPRAYKVQR
ncbi:zinc finger protein 239-like [Copidosoma floridanum]|uniref:zinc finger protein 239-like n=1 Tax=Copidosoma floridanum TaxID=29053 RepID=UPI0006C9596D|nr:zinc finger protein 239-like [Copidosoma floridanum]